MDIHRLFYLKLFSDRNVFGMLRTDQGKTSESEAKEGKEVLVCGAYLGKALVKSEGAALTFTNAKSKGVAKSRHCSANDMLCVSGFGMSLDL